MLLTEKLNFHWFNGLPVIRQSHATECGLACLGMIANYHGHEIDMITLRRRFATSLKGATLADVITMAQQLINMSSRALRVELEELSKLRTPCILHWELNHFVVLKRLRDNKIVLPDPARGIRELTFKKASTAFTGVALELLPTATFEAKGDQQQADASSCRLYEFYGGQYQQRHCYSEAQHPVWFCTGTAYLCWSRCAGMADGALGT